MMATTMTMATRDNDDNGNGATQQEGDKRATSRTNHATDTQTRRPQRGTWYSEEGITIVSFCIMLSSLVLRLRYLHDYLRKRGGDFLPQFQKYSTINTIHHVRHIKNSISKAAATRVMLTHFFEKRGGFLPLSWFRAISG
jgi:hypothetical protein